VNNDTSIDLGEMKTRWSQILQAKGQGDNPARAALLVRYSEAVYRYLLGRLRDPHAAGEVFSNFAVRVLEGDAFLQRADRQRGRFRDYLRAVLARMIVDHYRKQQRDQRDQRPLDPESSLEPADPNAVNPTENEEDAEFLACWRQEFLNKAWQGLEAAELNTGQPYCSAIRLKEANPGLRSAQLAEQLATRLGKPFSADALRKMVQRGRILFGDLLVAEVARSLHEAPPEPVTAEDIEQELIDLGLYFSYCKTAVQRYREQGGQAGR
jgi:RNA polymerase sigma-70 factor (ECF subfamily)